MWKSIGAVAVAAALMVVVIVAGTLVAAAVLASPEGVVTLPYLVANLAVSLAAAVLGGWVVVRRAPRRPGAHAAVLGAVLVLLTLPGLGSPATGQPAWYPAALLLVGVAGVASGAVAGMGWGGRESGAGGVW